MLKKELTKNTIEDILIYLEYLERFKDSDDLSIIEEVSKLPFYYHQIEELLEFLEFTKLYIYDYEDYN